jgi:transcriptional regulator with XRE-family HTH domain
MITDKEKLKGLLETLGWSAEEFADALDIDGSEVQKLFSGEAVGVHTARRFIKFLGAAFAQEYIDWAATGKENPYEKAGKPVVKETSVADYIRRKQKSGG